MSDSNNADGGDRKRRQTNTEYDDQGSEEEAELLEVKVDEKEVDDEVKVVVEEEKGKEPVENNDEYQAKKKQPKRSKEALARRAEKRKTRLKAKRQNKAKGIETLNKPKKDKVSKNFTVAITMEGRPATEEDRRSQMAALALGVAMEPSSSNQQPVVLRDSRVVDGVILLQCANEVSQQSVLRLLLGQNGIQVEAQTGPFRFLFGVSGYLVGMSGDQLTSFLHNQNPGLPKGSIRFISLHPGPSPKVFVDVTEGGVQYLEEHAFRLRTIETDVELKLAEGSRSRQKVE